MLEILLYLSAFEQKINGSIGHLLKCMWYCCIYLPLNKQWINRSIPKVLEVLLYLSARALEVNGQAGSCIVKMLEVLLYLPALDTKKN